MERLSLKDFIAAADDYEFSQYRVLSILNKYMEELHRNKLYPVFSDLTDVENSITALLQQKKRFEKNFPKRISSFDLKEKKVIYSSFGELGEKIFRVFDFIRWAKPKIDEGLKEAKAIYDFVEENIEVKEVGIIPLYKNEGYFAIRDKKARKLKIFKYALHVLPSNVSLHSFRTLPIEVYDEKEEEIALKDLKLRLVSRFKALPNPPIYFFETEIDFPFDETILPVAKRKLSQKIMP